MPGALSHVAPSAAEVAASLPGDDIVANPDVVMDRAFTVDGSPETVWPWLVQLGKARAGWYFPRIVERFIPPARRAIRYVDDTWIAVRPGDVIPDYGGKDATFEAVTVQPPSALVYRSRRGHTDVSWAIQLHPVPAAGPAKTRVQLRLRLGPVRHAWLARSAGAAFDLMTIAGMAAGLRERLADAPAKPVSRPG